MGATTINATGGPPTNMLYLEAASLALFNKQDPYFRTTFNSQYGAIQS